jgi:hypothetical protein
VAALLVALVVLVVVVGALVRRRREHEEVASKDAHVATANAATNPSFLAEGEYCEAGPGMHARLDHEYAFTSGHNAAGSEETTYDMAAGASNALRPEDNSEATYDVASNMNQTATYDVGSSNGNGDGGAAVYDTAAGGGSGGVGACTDEDMYALALAGLANNTDTDANVYCAASASTAPDKAEAVYDHAGNVPVDAVDGEEPSYDIGAASVGETDEPLYALGTSVGAEAMGEPLYTLGSNVGEGATCVAAVDAGEEEEDLPVAMDAGYVGCGGSVGASRAGSVGSGGSSSSFFDDNAFVATGDGNSVRLASVKRANPMYRQSVCVDATLDAIGEATINAEEDA